MNLTLNSREWRTLAAALLAHLALTGLVLAQTLGEAVGPQFPHLPMNARTAALADASTALIDTYAGALTNPSTLGFMKSSWADYTINRIQEGVLLQHVGLVFNTTAAGAFSVNLEYLHADWNAPTGVLPVRTSGTEFRLGIGYGYLLAKGVSFGLRLHYLHGATTLGSASAVIGDVGLTYSPGKYITYAVTLNGLNSPYPSSSSVVPPDVESSRCSRAFGVGLVFDYPLYRSGTNILFSMACDKILAEQYIIYKIGMEYKTFSLVRLRVGLKIRGTETEPRLGLGLVFSALSFDYAYLYSRRDQRASHMFTGAISWP